MSELWRARLYRLLRLLGLATMLMAVVAFVAGIPLQYRQLLATCSHPTCAADQLTLAQNAWLESVGYASAHWAALSIGLSVLSMLVWCGTGFLLFWRQAGDRGALLVAVFLGTYGTIFGDIPMALAETVPAWQLPVTWVNAVAASTLFAFFFMFPDGRFIPRWSWLPVTLWSLLYTASFLWPQNPLSVGRWNDNFVVGVFLLAFGSGVLAQIYRYRRDASSRQQQQTKWVVWGVAAMTIIFFLTSLPELLGLAIAEALPAPLLETVVVTLAIMLIPLSIGMAILRRHLWDIDLIIRRTVLYTTLSGILLTIYFGGVILLQTLLAGGDGQSPLAIVLSTLGIAALFQPLRRRLQLVIDRRFYRTKVDAAATLAAFSAYARDEVDLEQLSDGLLETTARLVQPAQVSLWLNPGRQVTADRQER